MIYIKALMKQIVAYLSVRSDALFALLLVDAILGVVDHGSELIYECCFEVCHEFPGPHIGGRFHKPCPTQYKIG